MSASETPLPKSGEAANSMEVDEIAPLITLAIQTYRRDLPQLLKHHSRQWVAYHGDKQIGLARNAEKLYRKCQDIGLKHGEYVVCCVLPEPPADEDLTPLFEAEP